MELAEKGADGKSVHIRRAQRVERLLSDLCSELKKRRDVVLICRERVRRHVAVAKVLQEPLQQFFHATPCPLPLVPCTERSHSAKSLSARSDIASLRFNLSRRTVGGGSMIPNVILVGW